MAELDYDEADRLIRNCKTYNFGMWAADKLAHEVAPALLDRVRELEAERDAALSTIAKVEALHTSEGWPLPGGRESKEYCTRCNCRWPCPTIRALGSVPSTGEGNE